MTSAPSGCVRGSLYFHFPGSKAQLAAEATRAEVDEASDLLSEALAAHADPADGIRAAFDAIARYLEETDFAAGCPVASLVLDVAEDAPDLLDIALAGFEAWQAMVRHALERAGLDKRRAESLAKLVIAAEECAILLARARRNGAPLRDAAEALARLVREAMPPAATRASRPVRRKLAKA